MNTGDKAKDQYGKMVTVLQVIDNVVYTTNGIYHITKLFVTK
jgi:hypothetical protein